MGCDIHLFVETRDSADAPWRLTRVVIPCHWCDGKGAYRDGRECYGCKGAKGRPGYDARNYDVFAILADVRNGTGFAGCDLGDGFIPIADRRGLPPDMCQELQAIATGRGDSEEAAEARSERLDAEYGETWLGDHSHSWLKLSELLACDWSRTTNHRGLAPLPEWFRMKEANERKPRNYCGGADGRGVRKVPEAVAGALRPCFRVEENDGLAEPTMKPLALTDEARRAWTSLTDYSERELVAWSRGEIQLSVYVPLQWSDTYAESAGLFHSAFIPALAALGKSPDDVRLVFGFDS